VFAVNRNDQRDVEYLYTDNNGFGPVHFKQGPDGFIYYADIRSGQIGRLEITDPNEPVLNPIDGTPGYELIFGTDADDLMDGLGGGDFFFGSLGDDTILGDGALYDQVDYRGDRDDYTFTRNGDGSVTVTSALDGTDTLFDVDGFWFQGSQEWFSLEQVLVAPGGQIVGTAGDDILNGTPRDDTMIGNGGSDQFQESLGDDTIIGDAGVYSQVNYFGRLEDYTFTRNADGTVTVENSETGTDTLTEIDGFWFNGSQVWLPIEDLLPAEPASAAVAQVLSQDSFDFAALEDSGPPLPRAEVLDFIDFGGVSPAATNQTETPAMGWDDGQEADLPDFGGWNWDDALF